MRILLAVLASLWLVTTATAAGPDLVVKESKLGVKETIDALAKALEAKGVKVVARVDHAGAAKAAGMELRPTEVLIFGNPKLGTPLMQSDQRVGIELPMRALAWQDAAGKVFIAYGSPDALKARFSVAGKDDVFKAMAGALEAFTAAATVR